MTLQDEVKNLKSEVHSLDKSIVELNSKVNGLNEKVQELVTKAEFAPVKLIVYGLATAVMTSMLMAIMAKVFIK